MRLALKRTLLGLWILVTVASVVALIVLGVFALREKYHDKTIYAPLYSLLILDICCYIAAELVCKPRYRKKTKKEFLAKREPVCTAMRQLTALPVRRVTTRRVRKPALTVGTLHVVLDENAAAGAAEQVAAVLTPFYDELCRMTKDNFPDYSERDAKIKLTIRRKRRGAAWKISGYTECPLYYLPHGLTAEARDVFFFPPKAVFSDWYI